MTTMHGVLFFYSETGTEGGYWGFQDGKFMNLPVTSPYWRCVNCGRMWDKSKDPEPKPSFSYRRPVLYRLEGATWMPHRVADDAAELPIPKGKKERIDWFSFGYDKPMTFPIADDGVDQRFNDASNAISLVCYKNGHEGWQSPEEQQPNGTWSYEGLHVPTNGDHLTIYDKADPSVVVWDGVIDLVDVGLFKEDAGGLWIHNDQRGIDRDTWSKWFFEENHADYTPKGAEA